MRRIFKKHKKAKLVGMLVWVPMLPEDSQTEVPAEPARDKRISQDWDAEKEASKAFASVLKLRRDAWDVYLIYAPGVTWKGDLPPEPSYWMHQLSEGAEHGPWLESKSFEEHVLKTLAAPKATK